MKQLSNLLKSKETIVEQKPISVRSTIFSLGSSSQVVSVQPSTPDLYLAELMKDSLNQLFVRINWKIPRFDVDAKKAVGFNVYRKKIKMFSGTKLSNNQFLKLIRNRPRTSKFSPERNGIFNVDRSLLATETLSPNLSEEQKTLDARTLSSIGGTSRQDLSSRLEGIIRDFEKIAFVDFSKFIIKEKQKQVFVEDSLNVSISFDDKTANWGETVEYFVTAVSEDSEETFQSDVIRILVKDNTSIAQPNLSIHQIDETQILLKISYQEQKQIDNIFIYRRQTEEDLEFLKVAEFFDVQKDFIEFVDQKVRIGRQYTYRVFLEDIHGVMSAPSEIMTFSSTNIQKSSSNVLRKPTFNAIQQKNIATINISPNDSKVLYYLIDRRDLSVDERAFIVPGRSTNKYGGNGWVTNQLFYDRINISSINFIDDTVSRGHVYQYRIVGIDRFGNKTGYSYQKIEILEGELLKSPTNLRMEILREFPFRIKISWDDENIYDENVKPFYEIQRRTTYTDFASFPLLKNQFIADEVISDDSLIFVEDLKEEDLKSLPDRNRDVSTRSAKRVSRSRGVLDFLKENFFYFYKVKIVLSEGSVSPFSDELKISTFTKLSPPIGFTISFENPKIKPAVVKLNWVVETNKMKSDHFVIERKIDNSNDIFVPIGKSYFNYEFFDRNVQLGKNYVYRIKSVNTLGYNSEYQENRIKT